MTLLKSRLARAAWTLAALAGRRPRRPTKWV